MTLESLKSLADNVLLDIFGTTIVAKIKIDHDENEPCLCVGMPGLGDDIRVFMQDGKFIVTYDVIIPGCRTMPNGDPGYPDDYDVIEADPHDAEKKGVKAVLTDLFNYLGIVDPTALRRRQESTTAKLFGDGLCRNEAEAMRLVVKLLIDNKMAALIEDWDCSRMEAEEDVPPNPAGPDTEM